MFIFYFNHNYQRRLSQLKKKIIILVSTYLNLCYSNFHDVGKLALIVYGRTIRQARRAVGRWELTSRHGCRGRGEVRLGHLGLPERTQARIRYHVCVRDRLAVGTWTRWTYHHPLLLLLLSLDLLGLNLLRLNLLRLLVKLHTVRRHAYTRQSKLAHTR